MENKFNLTREENVFIAKETLLIIKNYKYIYIYDNIPRYRFIRNSDTDLYRIIQKILCNNDINIIFHSTFKKVSNMKEARFIINYLSKVVLFDLDNTFLYFNKKDNDNVSIINYDREIINNIEKLYQIIENDRQKKDILVKTTTKNIINNYYRIGFKLYQKGIIDNKKNINEIVDENTRLIEKLSDINKNIEQEINKLMNR